MIKTHFLKTENTTLCGRPYSAWTGMHVSKDKEEVDCKFCRIRFDVSVRKALVEKMIRNRNEAANRF